MKWSRCFLLAPLTFSLIVAGCSRGTSSGSSTAGPNSTDPNLGDPVSEPGLFSFQSPKGWEETTDPEKNYSSCEGPAEAAGFKPSINIDSQGYQSPDDYVKSVPKEQGQEKSSFTTNAGVKGVRLVARDASSNRENVVYAFPGKNGLLLVFTGTCLAADDARFRPLFDASMKSLDLSGNNQ